MTKPYLFKRFEYGEPDMLTPVSLENEPVVGQCVWIAGRRFQILSIDQEAGEIFIKLPAKGYREPLNAIGTIDLD